MRELVLSIFLLINFFSLSFGSKYHEWSLQSQANPFLSVDVLIHFNHDSEKLKLLDSEFWSVSDNLGPKYQAYLNDQQIAQQFIGLNENERAAVEQWIINSFADNGLAVDNEYNYFSWSPWFDSLHLRSSVFHVEKLLPLKFHTHRLLTVQKYNEDPNKIVHAVFAADDDHHQKLKSGDNHNVPDNIVQLISHLGGQARPPLISKSTKFISMREMENGQYETAIKIKNQFKRHIDQFNHFNHFHYDSTPSASASPSVSPSSSPSSSSSVSSTTVSVISSSSPAPSTSVPNFPPLTGVYTPFDGYDRAMRARPTLICPDNLNFPDILDGKFVCPGPTANSYNTLTSFKYTLFDLTSEVAFASPWTPVTSASFPAHLDLTQTTSLDQPFYTLSLVIYPPSNYVIYNLWLELQFSDNRSPSTTTSIRYENYDGATSNPAHNAPYVKMVYGVSPLAQGTPALYGSTQNIQAVLSIPIQETYAQYNRDDLSKFYTYSDISQANNARLSLLHAPYDGSAPDGETQLDIQYMSGIGVGVDTVLWHAQPWVSNFDDLFGAILYNRTDTDPNPNVFSLSYGENEVYPADPTIAGITSRTDTYLKVLALKGISIFVSSGDAGAYVNNGDCTDANYGPGYPASSVYITSVGATQFVAPSNKNLCPVEVKSSTAYGALITSGGGTSILYSMPDYQKGVVESYFNCTTAPLANISLTNRMFPDVAILGHAYGIIDGGKMSYVDGTSASSPAFGGFISLINDRLISSGRKPLGFLNPLLYNLYRNASTRYIFNDITYDIPCDPTYDPANFICCPIQFNSCPGYDMATGLGSVDFSKLAAYLGVSLEAPVYKLVNEGCSLGNNPATTYPALTPFPQSSSTPTGTPRPNAVPVTGISSDSILPNPVALGCSTYKNCSSCTASVACGWSRNSNTCIAGGPIGSWDKTAWGAQWFFFSCTTSTSYCRDLSPSLPASTQTISHARDACLASTASSSNNTNGIVTGCGWCSTTSQCLFGSSHGPYDAQACSSGWLYNGTLPPPPPTPTAPAATTTELPPTTTTVIPTTPVPTTTHLPTTRAPTTTTTHAPTTRPPTITADIFIVLFFKGSATVNATDPKWQKNLLNLIGSIFHLVRVDDIYIANVLVIKQLPPGVHYNPNGNGNNYNIYYEVTIGIRLSIVAAFDPSMGSNTDNADSASAIKAALLNPQSQAVQMLSQGNSDFIGTQDPAAANNNNDNSSMPVLSTMWLGIIIGGGALLLIIGVVIVILVTKSHKAKSQYEATNNKLTNSPLHSAVQMHE